MYFPKQITAAQQLALINKALECSNTTERGNVLSLMGEAEVNFEDDKVTYTEELFWDMYDAAETIPDSTERAALLDQIDNTTFTGHPQRPPAK